MSSPAWNHLLVRVDREFPACSQPGVSLTADQVERLEAVQNASENFQITTLHGVAAIGELIVHAANHKELTDELAMSAGWLVQSLALLSMSMAEEGDAARYKLANIPHKRVAK